MRSLTRSESIGVITLLCVITALVGWTALRSPSAHAPPGIAIRSAAHSPSATSESNSSAASFPQESAIHAPTETPPSEIIVHVAGAVHKPGVYHLKPGSRNEDALTAAGGPLSTANSDAINLAAHIEDGTQLYLPTRTEKPEGGAPNSTPSDTSNSKSSPGSKSPRQGRNGESKPAKLSSPSQGQVNLNTAGAEELQKLPGIGPSMAERILAYRKDNGGFKSIEDLMQVSGIGEKRFEKMKLLVRLK